MSPISCSIASFQSNFEKAERIFFSGTLYKNCQNLHVYSFFKRLWFAAEKSRWWVRKVNKRYIFSLKNLSSEGSCRQNLSPCNSMYSFFGKKIYRHFEHGKNGPDISIDWTEKRSFLLTKTWHMVWIMSFRYSKAKRYSYFQSKSIGEILSIPRSQ